MTNIKNSNFRIVLPMHLYLLIILCAPLPSLIQRIGGKEMVKILIIIMLGLVLPLQRDLYSLGPTNNLMRQTNGLGPILN